MFMNKCLVIFWLKACLLLQDKDSDVFQSSAMVLHMDDSSNMANVALIRCAPLCFVPFGIQAFVISLSGVVYVPRKLKLLPLPSRVRCSLLHILPNHLPCFHPDLTLRLCFRDQHTI